MDAKAIARFWPKVDIGGPNDCWPWQAGRDADGYGRFWFAGKTIHASRACWMIANGSELPDGMHALHSCDNPPCCNPAHVYAGTAGRNIEDKKLRRRCVQRFGESSSVAKLTDAECDDIKRRLLGGEPVVSIHRSYADVAAYTTVQQVARGTARVLGSGRRRSLGATRVPKVSTEYPANKIKQREVEDILARARAGETIRSIHRTSYAHVSYSYVYQIAVGMARAKRKYPACPEVQVGCTPDN